MSPNPPAPKIPCPPSPSRGFRPRPTRESSHRRPTALPGLELAVALALAMTFAVTPGWADTPVGVPAQDPAAKSDRIAARQPASTARPVDVVFVLDNSGSMRALDPGFLTRQAVQAFADALATTAREQGFAARIGVVLFDEDVELALPLTPLAPDSGSAILASALARLDYSGQLTRSADAVERALYALRGTADARARQAIILLTDGKLDTGDPARDYDAATWLRDDLAGESRERGIRIFGLAFTDRADYQLLQAVARKTDAAYYRAERAEELAPITANVLARLMAAEGGAPIADASRAGTPSATAAAPDVAAAPIAQTADPNPLERLGWLPILVLLVAAGGFVGLRARSRESAARLAEPSIRHDLPPAQLLDVGGVLGETGRAIALQPGRMRIGRDPNNDIVIPDDTISSEHAVIEQVGGRYWLEDLRSTNGTKHGDARLARGERVVLKGGDHVRFADIDLMFVFAGYVPGGATVLLASTSAPPSHWLASRPGASARLEALDRSERARAAAEAGEAGAAAFASEAAVEAVAADAAGGAAGADAGAPAGGIGAPIEAITRPEAGEQTRPDESLRAEDRADDAYGECLDYHLSRVAELSKAFEEFVDRAFDGEMREAIRIAAGELVKSAQRGDQLAKRAYSRERIRYVLCGAPGGMDVAARTYQSAHGGFSRFLSEEISSESFRADRCQILAVLTFGRAAGVPWVSLSVVPDEGQDPRIDLLSYELLTDAERRAIEPLTQCEATQRETTQREVSQTGRA